MTDLTPEERDELLNAAPYSCIPNEGEMRETYEIVERLIAKYVSVEKARAVKAEQERDEARQYAEAESATRVNLANRVTELQNLLRFDQSDLRDAVESLEAAEARAAELEAGINALADELESGHVPDSVTDLTPLGLAPMVRALSRKRT